MQRSGKQSMWRGFGRARRTTSKVRRESRLRPMRQALEQLESREMMHAGFDAQNPIVTLHTNVGEVQIELYRDDVPTDAAGATRTTPVTVANFLKYVNDGDWINSFFHRSRDNFVVQGGGFTTSQDTFQNLSQFTNVPTDAAILNEPGNSNLLGTIAMARTSGVNSATSQFFFNLSDSNTFLDTSNQGFTVFGRIVGGSMGVVTSIAGLDTYNLTSGIPAVSPNPAPNPEPLYGFVPFTADPRNGNPAAELVVIESITGTGVIHGTIYTDADRDGQQDTGESGQIGVVVYVDANNNGQFDSGETSTTSGGDGSYHLIVDSGTHVIREVRPDGFAQTSPLNPAGRTVTVQIGGNVEGVDFGNVSALVGYRFETTDLAGNVRSNFQQGESFLLKVYVQDMRGAGAERGVGAAYLDVLYNNNGKIAVNGAITYGVDFDESQSGTTTTAGLINEAGAATFDPAFLGAGEKLLLTVPFTASASGEATFTGDPADNLPVNETLLQEPTQSVSAANQFFGALTITIGQQFAANNDGPILVVKDSTTPTTLDVLANDTGVASAVIFGIVQNPAHGTAVLASDNRTILYTPTAGYEGSDTLQYSIRDSVTQETRTATVTIDVREAGFPAAVDDNFVRILQNGQPILLSVLGNDLGDPQGPALSISAVTQPGTGTPRVVIDDNGTPGNTADDKIRYTPPSADFVGTETFTYTITDGTDSDTASVTFQSIRAAADTFSANEDAQGVTFDVTQNDVDVLSGLPSPTISFVGERSQGGSVQIVTVAGEQRLQYQPAPNKFGPETFIYRITDDLGNVSEATVTVNIVAANDSPTAADDAFFAAEDGGDNVFDVMANDSVLPDELGSETLQLTTVVGVSATNAQGATVAFSGTVTVTNGGTRITYRPAANFVGTETFEYTVTDGKTIVVDGATVSSSDKGRVTVTVNGANDNPTATNDTFSVFKNAASQTLAVLANDSFAPDVNETLTVTGVTGFEAGAIVTVAPNGTGIVYKPAPGFSGEDKFSYTISDGRGGTATAEVTVTVSDVIAGMISGFAFFDADGNGSMDAGEAPLSGVTVTLTGTPDGATSAITPRTTTSDAHGKYVFNNVAPGNYTVTQSQPSTLQHLVKTSNPYSTTFVNNSLSTVVPLTSGQIVEAANLTQASRATAFLGARDYFGRTNGDRLDISYNASGATLYYSMGSSWSGYSLPKVETLTGGRLRLTATDAGGVEQSTIVRLNDGFRIRPFDTTSATRIVQFLGSPADLGLPASSAASALAESSMRLASSAVDAVLSEDVEGDDFVEDLADEAASALAEGESLAQVGQIIDDQLSRIESLVSSRLSSGFSRISSRLDRLLSRAENILGSQGEASGALASIAAAMGSVADVVANRVDELLDRIGSRSDDASSLLDDIESRVADVSDSAASLADSVAAAIADRDFSGYRAAVDAFLADLDSQTARRLRRLSR